ncbi:MAG TPA: autotransporter outer membrane beta-barrel domain-containing protein [Rhodanobacteraceae bacterium]
MHRHAGGQPGQQARRDRYGHPGRHAGGDWCDAGYTANTHTDVLTATGGISGTFSSLVKDQGVVFTSTTIGYGTNDVYLDTTNLKITTAAQGNGVHYTPASYGSAVRVQGAFNQLNGKIAHGTLSSVSDAFVQNAGVFQHTRGLRRAQASLESLSGQLHAASAGMTLQAIGATGRALSLRMQKLATQNDKFHMWTHQLNWGGDMARSGYASVNYQLNGLMVGVDTRIDPRSVAGFAFSQGSGMEYLQGRFDRNRGQNTSGMVYAGWFGQRWYLHGRTGVGHYRQQMSRMLQLGPTYQGVWTNSNGYYNVAYAESGRHFRAGALQLTPFVSMEYDRVARSGFAERGAGGFGLKANAQTLSRWQGSLGLKLGHQWTFANGHTLGFTARAAWQHAFATNGAVFDASFVGLDSWQPLTDVGLSRRSTVFGLNLNARPSANTRFNLGYEYLSGNRGRAGVASTRFTLKF